jgi:hypothetical protein
MGDPWVVSSASLLCSFGMAPSTLNVTPDRSVLVEGRQAATIADMVPMVNIPPFGMCGSLSNPTVAAATTAALGVLTPMPCTPVVVGPWSQPADQSKTSVGGVPALTATATCRCAWGGVISVVSPGSVRTLDA